MHKCRNEAVRVECQILGRVLLELQEVHKNAWYGSRFSSSMNRSRREALDTQA